MTSNTPSKSILTTYLLWLFTGIFGGHRWYLEKRWSALTMSIGGISISLLAINTIAQYSLEETYLTFLELYLHPILQIMMLSKFLFIVIPFVIFVMTPLYLLPIVLAFDLFWIRSAIKKRNKGLTQQQIEAFD